MNHIARAMFIIAIVTLVAAFGMTSAAQDDSDAEMQALMALEIPPYDYAALMREFYGAESSHAPPAQPVHQIGDSKTFWLPLGANGSMQRTQTELRGMSENALIWVVETTPLWQARAQRLAQRVDAEIVSLVERLLGYSPPPGVDGDSRLIIVIGDFYGAPFQGRFYPLHALPRDIDNRSNASEMLVINARDYYEDMQTDDVLLYAIAHEYQHLLTHLGDASEVTWLNEALSSYIEFRLQGADRLWWGEPTFFDLPETPLTDFHYGDARAANYMAATLFIILLEQRFGEGILAHLFAEELDGWLGVDKVLREHYGASADEVFADWVLANYFQNADKGYGYRDVRDALSPMQTSENLRTFPTAHSGSLRQFGADYLTVNVRGADKLSLLLTQAPTIGFIEVDAPEGDIFYFAPAARRAYSTLERDLGRLPDRPAILEFKVWHKTAGKSEAGYVAVSVDDGKTWDTLSGRHTDYVGNPPYGYFGNSRGWLQERVRLNRYMLQPVKLRFGLINYGRHAYRGFAIDDLRIEALDTHDGFETDSGDWVAEGWLRTDNRIPQKTWLQVAQETDAGIHVERILAIGTERLEVDLLPNAAQVVIAVSPVVPLTALETEYSLVVNLLDEAGGMMTVSRDCQVTTTTGLNFRDAPNGGKLGLIPQGTEVDALDKRGEWFQVEYGGMVGWAHGGYVTARGNCP